MWIDSNECNKEPNIYLKYCILELLGILTNKKTLYELDESNEVEMIDIKSFDDTAFYNCLLIRFQMKYYPKIHNIQFNLKKLSKIVIRNLCIYLNYLLYLLSKNNSDLYKDEHIKLDISIIYEYFLEGYNKELIFKPEFFLISIKQLEKKYGIPCENYNTSFDESLKNEGKELIENLISIKKGNIATVFITLSNETLKSNDLDEHDKIVKIKNEFKKDLMKLSIEDFITNTLKILIISKISEY